jgi:uncharacterized protein (TIGR03437 family)
LQLGLLCLFACAMTSAFAQSAQTIAIAAVTNSADFQPGLPQKGSLASVFVTGLEGQPGIVAATQYPLSNVLDEISVWINFLPAPILAVAFEDGYQQINVQVPWEGQRDPLYVEVFQNGIRAHTEDTQTNAFSVFFSDANGYGVFQRASDYALVTSLNPAHAGDYVIAYGINLGPVSNTPASGTPSPANPLAYSVPPGSSETGVCSMYDSIRIGTATVLPSYVGLAPGSVGVYQVNFQLPASVAAGNLPVTLVRALTVFPWGECPGDGLGELSSAETSRAVTLPVR